MDAPTVTDAAELLTGTAASATSSATAIHWLDRDRSLTYGESVDAMARAAVVLAGFGVRPGGRVGLFAHPGLDYVVALLGTWRLQATAVLVDLADKDRFHELMTAAALDAVVYTNDHFDYVRSTLAALRTHGRGTVFAGMDGPQSGTVGWLEALAEAAPLAEPPAVSASPVSASPASASPASPVSASPASPVSASPVVPAADSAAVAVPALGSAADSAGSVATTAPASGTTRTHEQLIEAATAVADRLNLTPEDVTLCPTPLAQPFHLEASILPALLRGATAGLLKSWQPDDVWELMERNGTTVLCGTGDHCEQLLEVSAARGRKPHALRAAVTTALSPDLSARLRAQLHIDVLANAIVDAPSTPAGQGD